MKTPIDPLAFVGEILHKLRKGVLLTTCAEGRVNTMAISWGTVGIQWGKPIFTVFVRGCRHTKPMLDSAMEFTVNIPVEPIDSRIISQCGTLSGRDTDKLALLGLTTEPPQAISTPGIRQLPLTLECRVLYRQQQLPQCMADPTVRGHYPENSEDLEQDFHTAYYAEIVSAYIIS